MSVSSTFGYNHDMVEVLDSLGRLMLMMIHNDNMFKLDNYNDSIKC